jgi:hypothetical protein
VHRVLHNTEYCTSRDEGEHPQREVRIARQQRETCGAGKYPTEESQSQHGEGDQGEDAQRDTEPPVLVVVRGNGDDARRHHHRKQVGRRIHLNEPRTDPTVDR